MTVFGLIIAGAVIGGLARLLLRGKQDISVFVTVILGMLGCLVGYYLAVECGVQHTKGVDWIRWFISLLCSTVFISAWVSFMPKKKDSVTKSE